MGNEQSIIERLEAAHPTKTGCYAVALEEIRLEARDEIKRLAAMVEGDTPLPNPDHIIASRMEIAHQVAEAKRFREAHAALDRLFQSRLADFSQAESEVERLTLALQAIAIYDQDEKPQRDDRDSPFDWRMCSIKQEDIARATLKGRWPPPVVKQPTEGADGS